MAGGKDTRSICFLRGGQSLSYACCLYDYFYKLFPTPDCMYECILLSGINLIAQIKHTAIHNTITDFRIDCSQYYRPYRRNPSICKDLSL